MTLNHAIERLYDLNVGTTPVGEGSPHERPHKPLLLLAVFDLIDAGLATPDRIPWCQELRDRFKARFDSPLDVVRGKAKRRTRTLIAHSDVNYRESLELSPWLLQTQI